MKRALDHLEELLDDPRHRVGLRQVAAHHRGVDQVHRDGDGLVLRERLREPAVDVLEHAAGALELAGIEVLHLGAQGHLELDALVHPLDGKAEVVGDRDEGRRGDRHPTRSRASSARAMCSGGMAATSPPSVSGSRPSVGSKTRTTLSGSTSSPARRWKPRPRPVSTTSVPSPRRLHGAPPVRADLMPRVRRGAGRGTRPGRALGPGPGAGPSRQRTCRGPRARAGGSRAAARGRS